MKLPPDFALSAIVKRFFLTLLTLLLVEASAQIIIYLEYKIWWRQFLLFWILFMILIPMIWMPIVLHKHLIKEPRWWLRARVILIGVALGAMIYWGFELANYRPFPNGTSDRTAAPLMTMLFEIGYIAGILQYWRAF